MIHTTMQPMTDAMIDYIEQKQIKEYEEFTYEQWEKTTLAYAPDYYTIENDYDDDMMEVI